MVSASTSEQHRRATALSASLRQLRHETNRNGSADVVHQLRNSVLMAQGALKLVERRLVSGYADEVEMLLDLAEIRLRECRALVARKQCMGLGCRLPARKAA
jgi:hypothetical protein